MAPPHSPPCEPAHPVPSPVAILYLCLETTGKHFEVRHDQALPKRPTLTLYFAGTEYENGETMCQYASTHPSVLSYHVFVARPV